MTSKTHSAKDHTSKKEGKRDPHEAVLEGFRALLHDMGNLTLPLVMLTDPEFGFSEDSRAVRRFLREEHPRIERVVTALESASEAISEARKTPMDSLLAGSEAERTVRRAKAQAGQKVVDALQTISDELTEVAEACKTFLDQQGSLSQREREHIWCIYTEAVACAELIDSSLSADEEAREELHALIQQNAIILRSLLGPSIQLRFEFTGQRTGVQLTRAMFLRIILNLTANAKRAMGGRGIFTIKTYVHGQVAVLAVQDSGCGMTPELLRRVLEERHSTKEDAHNHGIGVHVVRTSVEKCGGILDVQSRPGVGTTFYLSFPRELH